MMEVKGIGRKTTTHHLDDLRNKRRNGRKLKIEIGGNAVYHMNIRTKYKFSYHKSIYLLTSDIL
jgi:hypothetical protein